MIRTSFASSNPWRFFASIEIYVCSDEALPDQGDAYLRERLNPTNAVVRMVERGDMALVRQFPVAPE